MNSDKLHHPQRSPPQNKNTSRVKKLGEVGLVRSHRKLKIIPPCHNSKRPHPHSIVHHRIQSSETVERLAVCQVITQRKIILLRACICVMT